MSDKEKYSEILRKNTLMVLEEMCFMFPEDAVSEKFCPEAEVCVPFSGSVSGNLKILTYGNIMSEIASNMSGDDLMDREKQLDALGEFGNVLCGNILPSLSEGAHFSIARPETAGCEAEKEIDPSCPAAEFVFQEGKIRIVLSIEL